MSKLDSKREKESDIEIRRGNGIVTFGQRKKWREERKGKREKK
jgi:hypothetical protein